MNIKSAAKINNVKHKVLLIGSNGVGKTTQILTLKGKTLIFIFDPGAEAAIKGHPDIDYLTYFPENCIDYAIKSIKRSANIKAIKLQTKYPSYYNNFASDSVELSESTNFSSYDNIVIDSLTTMQTAILITAVAQDDRAGNQPELKDYGALKYTLSKVISGFVSLDKNIIIIAHDDYYQDPDTKILANHLVLTGKLKKEIPVLFSSIFRCSYEHKTGKYFLQTRKDAKSTSLRTTVKNLSEFEDVTIKDFKNPQNYGLGKILSQP